MREDNQCINCPMKLIPVDNKNVLVFVCKTCGTIARYGGNKRLLIKSNGELLKEEL
jgi:RNase P subunit RPR2